MVNYAPAISGRTRSVSARVDPVLLGSTLILAFFGLVILYSATRSRLELAGLDPHYYLKRQGIFLVVALIGMVVLSLFDYRRLEQISTVLYVGMVLALLAVLSPLGSSSLGAQRWFSLGGPFQLQPSEFAALVLIIALATYCARRPEGLEVRDLVRMLLMAALPILLVFKQPDLGTAIVMSVILFVMLAVAGIPGRYLVFLILGAVVLVLLALKVHLLKAYQIDRLTSFISPNGPGRDAVYNVTQAKEAIASGGMFGSGLFHGAYTNLSYVPSQQTDFIFSAVGEQLGLVGSGILLALYGVLAWRILRTAQQAKDAYGRLICTGVFAMLIFSVFENMGMNMGIMPVAGIPLPFLSYGGSSMIVFFAGVGLVQSVHLRSVR